MKEGEGLAKEYTCLTHRHRQLCGDSQREKGAGIGGGRQTGVGRGFMGVSVIVPTLEIKLKNKSNKMSHLTQICNLFSSIVS